MNDFVISDPQCLLLPPSEVIRPSAELQPKPATQHSTFLHRGDDSCVALLDTLDSVDLSGCHEGFSDSTANDMQLVGHITVNSVVMGYCQNLPTSTTRPALPLDN